MYRRPWPIVIFAFFQIFIEPIANILLSAWMSEMSAANYLAALLTPEQWVGAVYVLALPILMGTSVYVMRKWSYSVFVACATWMLVQNFTLIQSNRVNTVLALAFYLGNLAFVSYFLIPAVRAPYLDQRMRWWESARRYLVSFSARVERTPGEPISGNEQIVAQIRDISAGGVFVSMPTPLAQDQQVRIRFSPNGKHILSMKAKVIFQRPMKDGAIGYGFQFIETNLATRALLDELLIELRMSGCACREPGGSDWEDFKGWISKLFRTGQGLVPGHSVPSPRPEEGPSLQNKQEKVAA